MTGDGPRIVFILRRVGGVPASSSFIVVGACPVVVVVPCQVGGSPASSSSSFCHGGGDPCIVVVVPCRGWGVSSSLVGLGRVPASSSSSFVMVRARPVV